MTTKYIFNRFNPLIAIAAVMLCPSCQKAGLTGNCSPEDYVIRFLPSVSLPGDNEADRSSTKGDLTNRTGSDIDFPSGKTFKVSAWTGTSQDFPYEDVAEKTDVNSNKYWITVFPAGDNAGKDKEHIWKKDENKTFYAYADLPAATGAAGVTNSSSTEQILTYDLSKVTDPNNQTDILLGSYKGTGTNGVATITFKHPLTAVGFTIDNIDEEKIKSIELGQLHKTGQVQMSDAGVIGNWTSGDYDGVSSQSTASDDGLTQTALGSEPTSPKLLGTWFLLIPQEITSEHKVKVTVTFVSGDSASAELSSGTWSAGKTNLYELSYSGASALTLTLTVIDWETIEEDTDLDSGNVQTYDTDVDEWENDEKGHITYTD